MKKILLLLASCVFSFSLNAADPENMFATVFENISSDVYQELLKEKDENISKSSCDAKLLEERYPIFCKYIGQPVYNIVESQWNKRDQSQSFEVWGSKIFADLAKFVISIESDDYPTQHGKFYVLTMLKDKFFLEYIRVFEPCDKNLKKSDAEVLFFRCLYYCFSLMSYCESPSAMGMLQTNHKFWRYYIESRLFRLEKDNSIIELNWYKDNYLTAIIPVIKAVYSKTEKSITPYRALCSALDRFKDDFEEYFSPDHTSKAAVALVLSGATAGISYKKLLPKSAREYLDTHPQAEKILYVGCGSVAAVGATYLGYKGYKKLF